MAELRRYEYGDPLRVLEQREAQTCKGCAYLPKDWFKTKFCWAGKVIGKRCKQYKEEK